MIWVIGGTKDSRLIVDQLLDKNYAVVVTTTTDYGASLLPTHPKLKTKVGPLAPKDMKQLIKEFSIEVVIDGSHPYAENVSRNIIAVTQELQLKLFRYERERIFYEGVDYFDTYDEIINQLKETTGNILLATGSHSLDFWVKNFDSDRLTFRVLPTTQVIKKCENLGLTPDQIIALQGPFTKAFNQALINFKDIQYLVTKESGNIGGFKAKLEAALATGIKPFVLQRPDIPYKNKFSEIDQLIKQLEEIK